MELVDSVDDLKSSCSVRGFQMPNFEVLDAKIASALNRIIYNTQFKRNVSLEEQTVPKRGLFPSWKTDRLPDLRVFLGHWSQWFRRELADLLAIALRNDDIQEFDSKWDGILLSMTKIPSDDILEGLYKLRIRESEKLKTVIELYDLEIHQKKAGPDYHRLKTMVKRSIEQNLRIKYFEARNGNYERNVMVKNQGTKQREQRTLGDWKVAFSRMHVLQDREWLQIWGKVFFYASSGWRTAKKKVQKEWWQKCSDYVEKYTTIGLRMSGYGAAGVFIDFAEELRHTETNPMCKIHKSRRTSCWHSRPKSIAWNDLFAQVNLISVPQCTKIWGSVSERDRVARARCPWSSVEAGQKYSKI